METQSQSQTLQDSQDRDFYQWLAEDPLSLSILRTWDRLLEEWRRCRLRLLPKYNDFVNKGDQYMQTMFERMRTVVGDSHWRDLSRDMNLTSLILRARLRTDIQDVYRFLVEQGGAVAFFNALPKPPTRPVRNGGRGMSFSWIDVWVRSRMNTLATAAIN
jgi:hypothetical protein